MSGAVVFLGPSLPGTGVPAGLLVLPPARQGDIFRAVRDLRPVAVGLIDGVFLDVPAVWHREILWAMDQGVHVLGAASMGALRAAELDRFGMRGVGRIYEAYRDASWPGLDAPFEDDDEVAVVHAPVAAGGAALSDAMVDLRATLDAALAAGMLDSAGRTRLAGAMKALAFPQRSFAALAAMADARLAGWLAHHQVRQKSADARVLLDAIVSLGPAPFVPAFRFTRALAWERFTQSQQSPQSPALERLRDEDPQGWAALRQQALGRLAALQSVPDAGEAGARAALDRFRIDRGLIRHEDIQAWLRQNAIDAADLARLMHEEASLQSASDPPGLAAAMLDLLVLSPAPGVPPTVSQ